jgi:hypothetical protein
MDDAVLTKLRSASPPAMFMTELAARLSLSVAEVEEACERLNGVHTLTLGYTSPDRHLTGDFRVVALLGEPGHAEGRSSAIHAADATWNAWLREFQSAHRCG